MHRFFIPPSSIHENTVQIQGGVAQQIKNVLRMSPGDAITVLDDRGTEYTVTLTDVHSGAVSGEITERRSSDQELPVALTLYQGTLKRDNFEWVLQKGTELGVTAFVPVLTQRVVSRPKFDKKQTRWERIIIEAAEQSHRSRLPVLHETVTFAQALTQLGDYDLTVILWEDEHGTNHLRHLLEKRPARIAAFIGPEGGFDAAEIELAHAHGVQSASLGKLILRAETAAIHVASVVNYVYG